MTLNGYEKSSESSEHSAFDFHCTPRAHDCHAVTAHSPLQSLRPFLSVAILMGFAIVHGVRRYGWRHFVIFFVFTFVISWSYETSSILSGFPFGHYYCTGQLGPKLWLVPLLIMPAYFSMGYLAWTLAHILLDRFDDRLAGANVVFDSNVCQLRDGDVGPMY